MILIFPKSRLHNMCFISRLFRIFDVFRNTLYTQNFPALCILQLQLFKVIRKLLIYTVNLEL